MARRDSLPCPIFVRSDALGSSRMTVVSLVEREPTVFNSVKVNPSCQSLILSTFEMDRVYED